MHGSKIFGPEQTVVLQIWQKKTTKKLTCTTFLYMIALRNKIVAHRSTMQMVPLRFRSYVTIVT